MPVHASPRLFAPASALTAASFSDVCAREALLSAYPLATSIVKNIPVYKLGAFSSLTPDDRNALQDEWYRVLIDGPGVLVMAGMYQDTAMIDRVSGAYRSIVDEERRRNISSGDHFAAQGIDDRIWNSFSKHALTDPESFVPYYANPYLSLVCEAWLGPGYRITAQMNTVTPGGAAQDCHRDYHLGFQATERAARFPRAAHLASQFLTLQGAIAHVDVPMESGPTRLLPYSQTFDEGYMAYRLPEFKKLFQENYVCLPMEKGDGLFFNPALFHAAGSNQSADIDRMVNLLQISSGMGRPMETIETLPLVEMCWDQILRIYDKLGESDEVAAIIAAVGNGYPFPTNLDKNAPGPNEMMPPCEQDVLLECLRKRKNRNQTIDSLRALAEKSTA